VVVVVAAALGAPVHLEVLPVLAPFAVVGAKVLRALEHLPEFDSEFES
jgi:hypothetical protein